VQTYAKIYLGKFLHLPQLGGGNVFTPFVSLLVSIITRQVMGGFS